jgi:tetratricopeptide (TPR) repeat protein
MRLRATLVPFLLLAGLAFALARAQQGEFAGIERVRVVELTAAIERQNGWQFEGPRQPVTPDQLELWIDGVEHSVASIETLKSASNWKVIIYFDLVLSSAELVRASAETLGANAESLTALGPVEIVVSSPEPRVLLPASSDSVLVDEALSGLLWNSGTANQILDIRSRLRPAADLPDAERFGLARELIAEERLTILRQQDRLLSWLSEESEPGASQALVLVSDGFDLQPEEFYRTVLGEGVDLDVDPSTVDHQSFAQAVAAFGWITLVVQRPESDPIPERWGLRRRLLARLDGNWDPQRAEALLELAQSLIRQENWQRAEAALRDAVYCFYDQPKRIERQAYATERLGFVLERQGLHDKAHKYYREALELDPSLVETIGVGVAEFLDPTEPLTALADETSGAIVRTAQDLHDSVKGLERRYRVSVQLSAEGERSLHPVELHHRSRGFDVLAPRWVRSATPSAVSAARARRLLDEDLDVETADGRTLQTEKRSAECRLGGGGREVDLEIVLTPRLPNAWIGLPTLYRVTTAIRVDAGLSVEQASVEGGAYAPGSGWRYEGDYAIDPEQPWLAVVVEELNTGRWLGMQVECDQVF